MKGKMKNGNTVQNTTRETAKAIVLFKLLTVLSLNIGIIIKNERAIANIILIIENIF